MKSERRTKMKEEKTAMAAEAGFTLIEILLVVAIIGMMAAVAAVNLGGQMGKAQVNAAKSSISAIRLAAEKGAEFDPSRGR